MLGDAGRCWVNESASFNGGDDGDSGRCLRVACRFVCLRLLQGWWNGSPLGCFRILWPHQGNSGDWCFTKIDWQLQNKTPIKESGRDRGFSDSPLLGERFIQDSSRIHPGFIQDSSRISPGFFQDFSRISPGFLQDFSRISPGFFQDFYRIFPGDF